MTTSTLTETTATTTAAEPRKWITTAGPRQTKKVNEALNDIKREGRTFEKINGVVGGEERRYAYMEIFGRVRPEATAAMVEIGERFGWAVTPMNHMQIVAACEAAIETLKASRPVTDERETPEQVAERNKICKEAEAKRAEEGRKRQERQAEILREHAHLTPEHGSGLSPWACGAANMRRELTTAFPGIRFEVKSKSYSGGSSIDAHWVDGPTEREAGEIIGRYQRCSFDGMTDMETRRDNAFSDVFGGASYTSGSRTVSGYIRAMAERVILGDGQTYSSVSAVEYSHVHKFLCGLSLKAGQTVTGIRFDSDSGEFVADLSEPAPVAPVVMDTTTGTAAGSASGVRVTENEEKDGVEIRFAGNPGPSVTGELKRHGFRWSKFQKLWYAKRSAARLAYAYGLAGKDAPERGPVDPMGVDAAYDDACARACGL